jgi:nitrogen regulatory protein PII
MTERVSALGRYGIPREEARLITGVLYRGAGLKALRALKARGINAAAIYHARGSSVGDPVQKSGLPLQYEKTILKVVVPPEQCDEILELVVRAAEIDRPTGGFFYVARLSRAMPHHLPDLPEEGTPRA